MACREKFLWCEESQKWLPANEVYAKRPKAFNTFNFNFKVYGAGHNHSLGGYCGSKADEQNLCSKIEEETGSRPEAIGDATLTNHGHRKNYD